MKHQIFTDDRELKIHFFLLILLLAFSTPAIAKEKEYFGKFNGEPKLLVKSNTNGRPTFILLEPFSFKDPNGLLWNTPKGAEVNGASIPQVAWSIFGGPMSGRYINASIIHDHYCKIKTRTAHDTHRNFYYGMLANGVKKTKARTMYFAVRTFGPSWKLVEGTNISNDKNQTQKGYLAFTRKAPDISTEEARKHIDEISRNMHQSLEDVDKLSDSIRQRNGAEALQKELN